MGPTTQLRGKRLAVARTIAHEVRSVPRGLEPLVSTTLEMDGCSLPSRPALRGEASIGAAVGELRAMPRFDSLAC
jgi:hypothetical protein